MKKRILNLLAGICGYRLGGLLPLANIAEGTHEGGVTMLTDAAITTRFLLGKVGTDANHVAVCGANDKPCGVIEDEADAAEDPVFVGFLGATSRSRKFVADDAYAANTDIFTAANGKVSDESAVAGTYYKVGRLLQASGADGDVVEAESHAPIALVVT